jgi:hypothetical protein
LYAWIWRRLPGEGPTKVLIALGLVLVAVALLWYVVFPWLEPKLEFDRNTVENGGSSAPAEP